MISGYGKGLYFGWHSGVAHPFAVNSAVAGGKGYQNADGTKGKTYVCAQLLCKVITGKRQPLHKEDFKRTQPDEGFDSTTSAEEQCITVYNQNHVLPLAIVEYTVSNIGDFSVDFYYGHHGHDKYIFFKS